MTQMAVDASVDNTAEVDFGIGAARSLFSYERGFKRALDLVLSLVVLVATLPIWLAVAIVIRMESPGHVLFVQDRVGRHGRRFRFYKFRSMYQDAEERLRDLQHRNDVSGPVFKMRRDPRVTRVGRFLRRSSLDELPQLLNILQGQMSLVGPRPPVPSEVAAYRPLDMVRLTVKPGLTCWWQIRGRSDCDFETWMAYDREYVAGLSLSTDIRILLGTFRAVISGRGAY